jgi:hypothetical protein
LFAHRSTLLRTGLGHGNLRLGGPPQSERAARSDTAGRCDENQCGQFSISISNGSRGMTVRFASEDEFREFFERGRLEQAF